MPEKKKNLHDFLTSGSGLAILVVALGFVVLSLLLFLLAGWLDGRADPWKTIAGPFRDTASLLLTVGGINFLLRTKIWKDAIDSVSERLHLKEATINSGLTDYWQFDDVPWKRLFDEAKTVTVVAISARPLLVERLAILRDFLSKDGTKLQLILSDFRVDALMSRFDAEFNEPQGTRARKLKEALGELLKALKEYDGGKVEICLSESRVPYSAYRFDDRVLFVPYIAEPVRDSRRIPALMFGEGGMVRKHLEPDLRYLLSKSSLDHAALHRLLSA